MESLHTLDAKPADLEDDLLALGQRARKASRKLALASPVQKNRALVAAAASLREKTPELLAANALDMAQARAKNLPAASLDPPFHGRDGASAKR